jgi:hypothetical protein
MTRPPINILWRKRPRRSLVASLGAGARALAFDTGARPVSFAKAAAMLKSLSADPRKTHDRQ